MKKFLALAISLFCMSASAQSFGLPFSIIVQGGYNGARLTMNDKGDGYDFKMRSGYRVGVAIDYTIYSLPMVADLSLQAGASFVSKGTIGKDGGNKLELGLNYLDIPVLLNSRFGLSDDLSFYVNAGPYVGFGLGGFAKMMGADGTNETDDVSPFDKNSNYGLRSFDFGAQVGAGVEYKRILVGVSSQFGLQDISKETTSQDKVKINNVGFSCTVGYRF